jgi:cyclophilin family peptidyl-prolyl cis-trans isomerase
MPIARTLAIAGFVGALLLARPGAPAAAAPRQEVPAGLRLDYRCDKRQVQLGDDVTITLTLTNGASGGDALSVLPLVLDARSVSLLVRWKETPSVKPGETATPVEHAYELVRLPTYRQPPPSLPAQSLAPGAALTGRLTVPCVRTGDLQILARYRGFALAPEADLFSDAAPLFVATVGEGRLGATLELEKGAVEVELDRTNMPATVSHVVALARAGTYDGTAFFRQIAGAWLQGGDAVKNDGTGDPGYTVPFEVPQDRVGRRHLAGVVSLCRGAHHATAATQFFVGLRDLPQYDFGAGFPHAAFGTVVKGLELLKDIAARPVGPHPEESPYAGEASRPATPAVVRKVTVWVR